VLEDVIPWCGFVGAWLLVAGPIYQATIELADEEFERETMERASAAIEAPPPVSRWLLFLPPVAYFLHSRRREDMRHQMLRVMPRTDLEQMLHFGETATAWLFVASGAALIAVKETWELREAYEWPLAAFWTIVAGMVLVCAANTALRVKRRHDILERSGP
jgi:hypothetical protein